MFSNSPARTEYDDGSFILTAKPIDTLFIETAVCIEGGNVVVVENAETEADALVNHANWKTRLDSGERPTDLVDVGESAIGVLARLLNPDKDGGDRA